MQKKKFQFGTIKRNPDGFGFFIPENPELPDVYIPRHSMSGVMTSDRVMIEIEKEKGGERFRGEIVKIVERGTKKIIGQYTQTNETTGVIKDEGKGWGSDLKIKIEDSMNAKNGSLVAAEILSYPDEGKDFRGRIVEVLGSTQDPLNDIRRVVLNNNIPHEFSKECEHEAKHFSEKVSEKDMQGRKDLRSLNFITIDGATAKDFDDAIFVQSHAGGFLLYVAIADVSHYVQLGSAIDEDAYERGTSVYFPNYVIPMLPEVLSNGLCSLNPHVPRLALVAEMHMNFAGEVQKSDFYEAVIESKARVTYGEAQEIIEGNPIEKLDHVVEEIKRASDLAKILMAKRFREGSLDLEIPETQLVIDAGGNPIDIIASERLFAHRVIEEMMLAANVAVAKFLTSKEIPALYRIHEPPNPDAIDMLEKYMRNFGGRMDLGQGKLQKRLTKALQEFENKPEAQILNILTLRSMSQAKYSPNNVGHFGLGFDDYTHFTSPIRRYPDLIVHRLIKNQIMPQSQYRLMSADDLAAAGSMLSACEQRSVKAERQLQGIKKARYMQKHLGDEFDGMISSVTKFGIFVLLRDVEIDGLVRAEDLGTEKFERFEFDEDNLQLVAARSGLRYSIGDLVRIRVVSVDIEAGQINFELAARPQKKAGSHLDRLDAKLAARSTEEKHSERHRGKKSASRSGRHSQQKNHSKKQEDRHHKSHRRSKDHDSSAVNHGGHGDSANHSSSGDDEITFAGGPKKDRFKPVFKRSKKASGKNKSKSSHPHKSGQGKKRRR